VKLLISQITQTFNRFFSKNCRFFQAIDFTTEIVGLTFKCQLARSEVPSPTGFRSLTPIWGPAYQVKRPAFGFTLW
ncbi:MAG: hypothetical protein ACK4N1_19650, partial [Pseudorhizobium sp.]